MVYNTFFLPIITAKRDNAVRLHAKPHYLYRQYVRIADYKTLVRPHRKRADVAVALHLRVIADDKTTAFSRIFHNLAVCKMLVIVHLLKHVYNGYHHRVIKHKLKRLKKRVSAYVFIVFVKRLYVYVKPRKVVVFLVFIIYNSLFLSQNPFSSA